jgi:hypothetical protein
MQMGAHLSSHLHSLLYVIIVILQEILFYLEHTCTHANFTCTASTIGR